MPYGRRPFGEGDSFFTRRAEPATAPLNSLSSPAATYTPAPFNPPPFQAPQQYLSTNNLPHGLFSPSYFGYGPGGGLQEMFANQFGAPPQVGFPQSGPQVPNAVPENNPISSSAGALPMMMNGFNMMNNGDSQAKAQIVNQATSMNQGALDRMQQLAMIMRQRMGGV